MQDASVLTISFFSFISLFMEQAPTKAMAVQCTKQTLHTIPKPHQVSKKNSSERAEGEQVCISFVFIISIDRFEKNYGMSNFVSSRNAISRLKSCEFIYV